MFASFFKELSEKRPEVHQVIPGRPRGFFEQLRATTFQSTRYDPRLIKVDQPLWSKLSGNLYTIVDHHLSVVLAQYEDGTVLWLDDHSSDSDFEVFTIREDLSNLLPGQAEEVSDLIARTKFNFLGWPHLIRQVSDIAEIPKNTKRMINAQSKEHKQVLADKESRLLAVASQIHPPTCLNEGNRVHLKFYIWTKLMGNLFEVNCAFGPSLTFTYEAVELVDSVGFYVNPR